MISEFPVLSYLLLSCICAASFAVNCICATRYSNNDSGRVSPHATYIFHGLVDLYNSIEGEWCCQLAVVCTAIETCFLK